jgi:hypothetical protein
VPGGLPVATDLADESTRRDGIFLPAALFR